MMGHLVVTVPSTGSEEWIFCEARKQPPWYVSGQEDNGLSCTDSEDNAVLVPVRFQRWTAWQAGRWDESYCSITYRDFFHFLCLAKGVGFPGGLQKVVGCPRWLLRRIGHHNLGGAEIFYYPLHESDMVVVEVGDYDSFDTATGQHIHEVIMESIVSAMTPEVGIDQP